MGKRNFIKALLAGTVMFGSVTAAVTAEEAKVTYETILGEAYDYGITAASFNQGNHMQSNFATINFSGNNVLEADLSGEGHVPIIAGTIANDSVLRFGNHTAGDQPMTYDVTTSSPDRVTTDNPQKGQLNIVNKSASEIENKVNAMINRFVASSATLKEHAPTITLSDDWWNHFDQNNAIIDLTSYSDSETVYINVPDTAYNFRNALNCSNGLHIVKNSGTTVVFNIPDESISFNKFRVTVNGQEYNTDPSTSEGTINQNMDNEIIRKIYFNCYNAKTVRLANTAGLFLIPRSDATVTVEGTSSGWIATGGHATNPSGEWHFDFHARSAETTNPGATPVEPEPEPEQTGKLIVTETVRGLADDIDFRNNFNFKIKNNETSESSNYSLTDFNLDGIYTKEFDLPVGEYSVTETVTDVVGYSLIHADHAVDKGTPVESYVANVTIEADGTEYLDYTTIFDRTKHDVAISKIDATNSVEIAGATLIVTDADSNKVEQWVSEADTTHMISLTEGTYTLTEITAPEGYEVAESITFEVGADGLVKVDGNTVDKVVMKDEPTPVTPEPTPEPEKVDVTVTKVWEDANNQDGKRPQDITVILTANDVEQTEQRTLNAESNWTATFNDLNKFDESGNKIVYSVKELTVDEYTSAVQGSENDITIINTHNAETRDIAIQTKFNESITNKPDEINVDLLGNDKPVDSADLNEDNDYSHTFEDIPVYEFGEEVSYRFSIGRPIPGFVTRFEGNVDEGFYLIADEEEPEKGKLIITKTIEGPVTNEEAEGALQFEVYSPDLDDTWEFTLADFTYDEASNKYTLELDLPVGSYEVTETVTDIWRYELARASYTVNNGTEVEDTSASVIVSTDSNVEVAYRDEYDYVSHPVVVNKVDAVTQEKIADAQLAFKDDDGRIVEKWTTIAGESHTTMLKPCVYTLVEMVAPEGYEYAAPIVVEVTAGGLVKADDRVVEEVVMHDAMKTTLPTEPDTPEETETGTIRLVKHIEGDIDRSLFEDSVIFEFYETDKGISYEFPLSMFSYDENTKAYYCNIVKPIGNYDVFEVGGDVEDYNLTVTHSMNGSEPEKGGHLELVLGTDEEITIEFTNKYTLTDVFPEPEVPVIPEVKSHKVVISKQDVTGKEIAGAELVVTKDGKEVDRWVSVENESHEIELTEGNYTLTETLAPEGFKIANNISFKLDSEGNVYVNDEKVDKIIMVDEYDKTVEEDNGNDEGEHGKPEQKPDAPTKPEEKPSVDTTGSDKKNEEVKPADSVDTADRTNVIGYSLIMMTSILAFTGTAMFRRRH